MTTAGLKRAAVATALPAVILVGHSVAPVADPATSAAGASQVQPNGDSWSLIPASVPPGKRLTSKSLEVDSWS